MRFAVRLRDLLRLDEDRFGFARPEAPDSLEIRRLVHPLRYDILVRKAFFDLCAAERELAETDFDRFLDLARGHDYHLWFRHVMVARFGAGRDAASQRDWFARRVRKSLDLLDSFRARGFDSGHPIVLHTGRRILASDSGRRSRETLFMGDGCHRLACLMSLGRDRLLRDQMRIKRFRVFSPLDNTALLAKHMEIDWPPEFTAPVD